MKTFYGDTFIDEEELKEIGINYPIKLEYYKTYKENAVEKQEYGIEIIKSSYSGDIINIEKRCIENVIDNDYELNKILKTLKENKVTPVCAKEVIDDLLYVI